MSKLYTRHRFTDTPSNFHLFPGLGKFDEGELKLYTKDEAHFISINGGMADSSSVDVDVFVAWVKHWHQNGA